MTAKLKRRLIAWSAVLVLGLSFATSATALGQTESAAPAGGAEAASSAAGIEAMDEGSTFVLDGRKVTVRRVDVLPYVDSEYAKRFVFDRYDNPKLKELRTKYQLDDVVASGRDEFEKQVLLMAWVHEQWDFGDPQGRGGLRNALEILDQAKKEQKFFCVQFAATLVSTSASMGWVCRPCGKSTHSWTEMWSNQYGKWVFFDPTPNLYVEKDGVPLSTQEIRRGIFEDGGEGLVAVNARTGERSQAGSSLGHRTVMFIPNTNWLDAGPNYGKAFVIRDQWSGGAGGSSRKGVENPDVDPYFPINQAALSLRPAGDHLAVAMQTLTPNFRAFQVRLDDGEWTDISPTFPWRLHDGQNLLEARAVNEFGVAGPPSTVELVTFTPPSAATAAGAIVVPAISFSDEGGGRVAIRDKGSMVTPGYVHFWHTPGQWLEWTVDGAEPDQYDVILRYGTRFPTRRELSVNGRPAGESSTIVLKSTGGWTKWKQARLRAKANLVEGRNVLRLTCLDDASLCLNEIRLSRPGRQDMVIDPGTFSGQGGGTVQTAVSDEAGYFFSWDDAGHAFEWAVDGATAGAYDVHLRYASLVPSSRELRVNGEPVEGLESFAVEPSGGWRFWVEAKLPAQIQLKSGRNVLRMTNTKGVALNLSAIQLVGPDGRTLLIPAVDYTLQEGGKVREVRRSRHGSFYMWNDPGHWLEWAFDAPAAGRYEMTLRYATRARSPREVRVNGEPAPGLESVTLEPTGDWSAWRDATLAAKVTLKAGRNVLRMTSLGGGGLNLDEIRLTPAGD